MPARSHTPAGGWSAARVVPYRPCQSSPSPRCPTVGAGSSRFLAKIPPPPPPKTIPVPRPCPSPPIAPRRYPVRGIWPKDVPPYCLPHQRARPFAAMPIIAIAALPDCRGGVFAVPREDSPAHQQKKRFPPTRSPPTNPKNDSLQSVEICVSPWPSNSSKKGGAPWRTP